MAEEKCTIEWGEFHYHLVSWLIDKDTPRELAMGIELQIFKGSYLPEVPVLNEYVSALESSEGPEEFMEAAKELYVKYNTRK